jgi:hypothetical protein
MLTTILYLVLTSKMAKEHTTELMDFLEPFNPGVREIALWLREFVWDLYPTANELIYDNYNAVAIGWSPTERVGHTFCNVSIMRTNQNIQFGFYWGSQIADPGNLLIGNGNQYRYLVVRSKKDFPIGHIKKLLKDAYINSVSKVKDPRQFVEGQTITKSVSTVKRTKKATGKS